MKIEKAKQKPWRRTIPEINKELNEVKDLMPCYGPFCDTDKPRYQYWRGVRNALLWVIYNQPTPIRYDHDWELGRDYTGEAK